jgi:competence protein ComEA
LELSEPKIKKESKLSSLNEKSININTATKDELTKLPGVGEKTADNIILLRNKRGKFTRLEDLLDVKGIGESKFNKIKKFLYIE